MAEQCKVMLNVYGFSFRLWLNLNGYQKHVVYSDESNFSTGMCLCNGGVVAPCYKCGNAFTKGWKGGRYKESQMHSGRFKFANFQICGQKFLIVAGMQTNIPSLLSLCCLERMLQVSACPSCPAGVAALSPSAFPLLPFSFQPMYPNSAGLMASCTILYARREDGEKLNSPVGLGGSEEWWAPMGPGCWCWPWQHGAWRDSWAVCLSPLCFVPHDHPFLFSWGWLQ